MKVASLVKTCYRGQSNKQKWRGGKIKMQQIIILHRQVNEMKRYPFNYLTICYE